MLCAPRPDASAQTQERSRNELLAARVAGYEPRAAKVAEVAATQLGLLPRAWVYRALVRGGSRTPRRVCREGPGKHPARLTRVSAG